MNFSQKLLHIQDFLKNYIELWSKEPLDHFPHHYSNQVQDLISPYLNLDDQELLEFENDWNQNETSDFLKTRKELISFPKWDKEAPLMKKNLIGMNTKKRHEISRLIPFIKNKIKKPVFIDLGAGVGHLAFNLLSEEDSFKILVIDQDKHFIQKGKDRSLRRLKEKKDQVQFKQFEIQEDAFPKIDLLSGTLHGLHCCGDFSLHILKWFLQSSHSDLILTSCCYHHLTKYNLSQKAKLQIPAHALHLAAKGDNFQTKKDFDKRSRVKSYRYALELFFQDQQGVKLPPLGHLPAGDYDQPFEDYAFTALDGRFLKSELLSFYQKEQTQSTIRQLIIYGIVRGLFSKLLETYLILDRAIWLKEKGMQVEIHQLFDRELSPRNLTIYARKN